jgi:hypothetical protein
VKNNFKKSFVRCCKYNNLVYLCLIKSHTQQKHTMIKHIAPLSLEEANELAAHQAAANATQASVKALDQIQEMSSLLISLEDKTKVCTWDDVENCFPKDVSLLDDDFILWVETIKSEARQIYLLEKAGDKSENEAARAAIQFIHKKATK